MLSTLQAFKFGTTEEKLFVTSPKAAHKPQFIYVDDVLQVFQISGRVKFKTDEVSISYMRDDNGTM